ncbi:MAG: molybdopterin molybdenumtransferase MoeA, partial [Gemmatimonadaceae bacterium]|nr:molybdopterin molybdenumtransferase MoeA [Acetobacteraceae bacterium]
MAQLSDDCFAFGGALMTLDAARATIVDRVGRAVEVDRVPLLAADGRILATDVAAPVDL